MKFKTAFLAIFCVLLVHAFALSTNLYYFFEPFDIPMHLAGGFVMGLLGLAIYDYLHPQTEKYNHPAWYKYLFATSFAILIAVLWEFHEYALDQTIIKRLSLAKTQISLDDTMLDLLMGTLGGLAAALIFGKKQSK